MRTWGSECPFGPIRQWFAEEGDAWCVLVMKLFVLGQFRL